MSRINTNVQSLIAQRNLSQQNQSLNKTLERLSTGYRINRGGDDPAGLIASEALRSEKASLQTAIGNAERAEQVVNVAEGGLQEVNSLLLELQSLIGQSGSEAGLSTEEKEANQQQIDDILSTIDRISQTTTFGGTKLLNGSFDFTVSGQNSDIVDLQVNGAKLGNDNIDVDAIVTQSAQQAGVFLSLGASGLGLAAADEKLTVEIAGANGLREFSFGQSSTLADMASQINSFTEVTGVSAAVDGTGIALNSVDTGSAEFVSIDVIDDGGQAGQVLGFSEDNALSADSGNVLLSDLASATNSIRDDGEDVGALVNGIQARGIGNKITVNSDTLSLEATLSADITQTLGNASLFTVTGGGASFNLGPSVDLNNQVRLGIPTVQTSKLGVRNIEDPDNAGSQIRVSLKDLGSGRALNVVDGDLLNGQKVVDDTIKQISTLRGRLGAFQKNVIGSTINALGVTFENIAAAESAIRDTDFAEATADLTRSQVLQQAAQSALSLANAQPQSVLSLLG